MGLKKKMVAAYLSDWAWYGIREGDENKLTHINYSFATLVDGKVSDAHWSNGDNLDDAVKRYPHIDFIISIGGWGAGGFSEAVATEKGRLLFAESALHIMNKHGFKGIDLDWEYPCRSDAGITSSPDDKYNFTLLMELLRKMLDDQTKETGVKYLLSMAVAAGESYANDLELDKLNKILDYVNLMSYDMARRDMVTHHTNLYPSSFYENGASADTGVKVFSKAGISVEKLVIGGAFYGHSYDVVTDGNVIGCSENVTKASNLNYTKISGCEGYTYYFDDSAKAPYLYNGENVIVYDDPVSLGKKVEYIFENNLGGLMFWEYNGDRTGELLDAIDKAVKRLSSI